MPANFLYRGLTMSELSYGALVAGRDMISAQSRQSEKAAAQSYLPFGEGVCVCAALCRPVAARLSRLHLVLMLSSSPNALLEPQHRL